MKTMKRALMTLIVLALTVPALAQQKPAEAKEGVALTVYNGNYAVIREVRKIDIKDGVVYFKDVAQQIDPTTVHFKSLTDPKAVLLEQNYQFDLVSPDKMLQKYLDKPIEVIAGSGDKQAVYAGTLMSFDSNQLVLKEKDGKIVMVQRPNNVRDIRFSALPEGLLVQPTLVWQVRSQVGGQQLAEVSYQTGGINWHAEYVLVLNGDDTAADLAGWVSVDNRSGKTYKDAQLKFIAGDVRKIVDNTYGMDLARGRRQEVMTGPMPAEPAMVEQAFFEYHMYTLGRRSTVASNEVKQLELFPQAADVKVSKRFLMYPTEQFRWWGSPNTNKQMDVGDKLKAKIFVEFKNSKENNLGLPLPAGKVRAYKRDPVDGAMEFIGEERIDHTPQNETLSLNIGTAFDIIGERKQTKFELDSNRRWMRESIEITVRNHKKEPIVVRVKENFFRTLTNKLIESSHPQQFQKLDASTAAWDLPIPATENDKPGEVTLTYTVEYTW